MVDVNIFNTVKTLDMAAEGGVRKYFCVSTDKAANPVNMMGASKRIMEMFILRSGTPLPVSTARFANVAFSDGSLLYGFNRRILKRQPIAAPHDVRRYFVTPEESGILCLMSALLGEHMDIFFPKLEGELHMITFAEIAERYLRARGYEPYSCESEEEARCKSAELIDQGKWPCYFFESDTTGEKPFEEFYTSGETVDMERFASIGVVKSGELGDRVRLDRFLSAVDGLKTAGTWTRDDLIRLFNETIPNFDHLETGKFLDGRM
jgi:UDP-N-acetylglucosamine 4,6-dehydratase